MQKNRNNAYLAHLDDGTFKTGVDNMRPALFVDVARINVCNFNDPPVNLRFCWKDILSKFLDEVAT